MSPLGLFSAGLFFWAGLVQSAHGPVLTPEPHVRLPFSRIDALATRSDERVDVAVREISTLLAPHLVVRYDIGGATLAMLEDGSKNARVEAMLLEFGAAKGNEESAPGAFGGELFERRVFDFGRRCFNSCPLGGWAGCAVETRVKQDECEGIAGRTLVSAAARRAPLVREVLKLVGSRTTAPATDVGTGVHVAAELVRGGGTLGMQARW